MHVLEVLRPVRALDDLGGAIVLADPVNQRGVAIRRAFGDENVAGPPQVLRRFAQRAAREQVFVAEGGLAVDEHDVEPVLEMDELHAVIEQQRVAAHFVDGVKAARDAVFIHEHDHVLEIHREHVGLVACHAGVE